LGTGLWYYHQASIKADTIMRPFYNKEFSFKGILVEEPDVRNDSTKLTLKIYGSHDLPEEKVLVTTNRYPRYNYGDKLHVKGEIKRPAVFEDFDYREYLAKDGIYSVMYWPQIEKIDSGCGNSLYSKILSFKKELRESIHSNLFPPQSSLLGSLILGDKGRMSDNLKEELNKAGIRHITAISGLHVVILTSVLMSFLLGIGLWRKQAFYLTVGLIFLFVAITGFQISAVRAAIIGTFSLVGQNLGRRKSSSRALAFTAAVMLIANPLLLKSDVGFQLSFLAVIGIVYLNPLLEEWLEKMPNFLNLRSILAVTLSAQVFALPVLSYSFGRISLMAPVSNLFVMPVLPFVIVLGFIFAFLGTLSSSLGWVLSLPIWLLLTYLLKVAHITSSFPFSYLPLKFPWFCLGLFYLILGLGLWKLYEGRKLRFLKY